MPTLKLGILVSGSGTNLQAILDAVAAGSLDAEVRVVISNRPGVRALTRATDAGVSVKVIAHRDFPDRRAFDEQLVAALREADVSLVVMAGFMRVVTSALLDAFPWQVVNIHPALLPAFPGVHGQQQAWVYGAKLAGCTVHFVDAGTDTGPIIAQAVVPVLDADSAETLSARILEQEHRLLVAALGAIATGDVKVVPSEGGRPRVESGDLSARLFAGGKG